MKKEIVIGIAKKIKSFQVSVCNDAFEFASIRFYISYRNGVTMDCEWGSVEEIKKHTIYINEDCMVIKCHTTDEYETYIREHKELLLCPLENVITFKVFRDYSIVKQKQS